MIQRLSYGLALNTMLIMLSLVALFHLLVLAGAIPYEIVWAGKLDSREDMLLFESFSVGINVFLLVILCMKANYFSRRFPGRLISFFLWLFASVFFLNTIGNLFSETLFEKLAFTPLTLLFSVLLVRIAVEKRS